MAFDNVLSEVWGIVERAALQAQSASFQRIRFPRDATIGLATRFNAYTQTLAAQVLPTSALNSTAATASRRRCWPDENYGVIFADDALAVSD